MSGEKLNLFINSTKKIERQPPFQKPKDYVVLPQINSPQNTDDQSAVAERLRKLQSNLRILQKQYRMNLKQGFDNKIKAYRLEAVVQRKLLKQAISSITKRKDYETIQQKKRSTQSNSIRNSRIELMKVDRQNREKNFKKRQFQQKKSFSVSLNEAKMESEEKARSIHDKIIKQGELINRKRDYFTFVRKDSFKKEEEEVKQDLLKKIITNTEKLKDLKHVLESLKGRQVRVENTFLTI